MDREIITLTEYRNHYISLETFYLLFASFQRLCIKWGSFSDQTKEDIWEYFHYLRGLVEIHASDKYSNWNYWQDVMTEFMQRFDENNPYYDGNFEKVVLDSKWYKEERGRL